MFARPLVREEDALSRLAQRRRFSFAGKRPRPERVELVYFPYYQFRLTLSAAGEEREVDVVSDGVLGDFAFLETSSLDCRDEADAHRFDFRIDEESARAKVLDEYQWLLVKHGFHAKNPARLKGVSSGRRLYYPYWVAYYRKRKGYDFKVVDGISLAPIGMRLRRSFLAAFSQ